MADVSSKKKFLLFFWCMGWIFSALLYFCAEGDWISASIFFVLANTGFTSGNAFYNAFLNDISDASNVGRISGFGWAVGYIGGGLLLAINLVMIQHPAWFHLPEAAHIPVRHPERTMVRVVVAAFRERLVFRYADAVRREHWEEEGPHEQRDAAKTQQWGSRPRFRHRKPAIRRAGDGV